MGGYRGNLKQQRFRNGSVYHTPPEVKPGGNKDKIVARFALTTYTLFVRLIEQFRTLLRVQQSPLQQRLQVAATINYQQNVHVPVHDSVNDAVRFKKDLSVFANPQRE